MNFLTIYTTNKKFFLLFISPLESWIPKFSNFSTLGKICDASFPAFDFWILKDFSYIFSFLILKNRKILEYHLSLLIAFVGTLRSKFTRVIFVVEFLLKGGYEYFGSTEYRIPFRGLFVWNESWGKTGLRERHRGLLALEKFDIIFVLSSILWKFIFNKTWENVEKIIFKKNKIYWKTPTVLLNYYFIFFFKFSFNVSKFLCFSI